MSSSNLIVELTLAILVLLSIVTWSIGLIKLRQWRRASRENAAFLEAFWKERGWGRRVQLAREGRHRLHLATAQFVAPGDRVPADRDRGIARGPRLAGFHGHQRDLVHRRSLRRRDDTGLVAVAAWCRRRRTDHPRNVRPFIMQR